MPSNLSLYFEVQKSISSMLFFISLPLFNVKPICNANIWHSGKESRFYCIYIEEIFRLYVVPSKAMSIRLGCMTFMKIIYFASRSMFYNKSMSKLILVFLSFEWTIPNFGTPANKMLRAQWLIGPSIPKWIDLLQLICQTTCGNSLQNYCPLLHSWIVTQSVTAAVYLISIVYLLSDDGDPALINSTQQNHQMYLK